MEHIPILLPEPEAFNFLDFDRFVLALLVFSGLGIPLSFQTWAGFSKYLNEN